MGACVFSKTYDVYSIVINQKTFDKISQKLKNILANKAWVIHFVDNCQKTKIIIPITRKDILEMILSETMFSMNMVQKTTYTVGYTNIS